MESKQAEAFGEERLLGPTAYANEPPPHYQPQPAPYPIPMYPDQGYTSAGHVVVAQPVMIPSQQEPPEPVPDYLCLSIFNTLCCCLCIGIAAIVTSSQANSMKFTNNRLAAEKARTARNLNIAGLVCGIIIITIYLILKYVV